MLAARARATQRLINVEPGIGFAVSTADGELRLIQQISEFSAYRPVVEIRALQRVLALIALRVTGGQSHRDAGNVTRIACADFSDVVLFIGVVSRIAGPRQRRTHRLGCEGG